jgi:acyl-homoserine-lactone acylase
MRKHGRAIGISPTVGAIATLVGAAALLLGACGQAVPERYEARISRTSYGIPHIVADDWGGLGFGEGYAFAEDHLCTLADQVVRVRSQRAEFFGAGPDSALMLSDLGLAALNLRERAAEDLDAYPDNIRSLFEGYAAGYNLYLTEVGSENVPGWCGGEPWVGEISALDVAAYARSLFMISAQFAPAIAAAQPPQESVAATVEIPWRLGASNGWGIGSERSESGRGMLLANPHYPWVGSNRFWEKHLTIPGELDTYGVSLLGTPGVLIGFNENVAWTHTVSSGVRFTLYRLELVKGQPTTYLVDGEEQMMEAREVTTKVRQDDGSLRQVAHTVYWTRYGPVVSFGGMEWTEEYAFALRDANADNDEAMAQWVAMDQASGMDEFQAAHARYAGMPWVNTISTSSEGRAWYADVSRTPNLSEEAVQDWQALTRSDPMFGQAYAGGMVLLDGSDSLYEWVDDPDARDPGILPFDELPQLERRDYVFNANDSYWLANSSELLTGLNPLLALQEGTARSPRTRMNDVVLSDRTPTGPAGEDGRFSLEELEAAAFSNRALTAELLAPLVAARCQAHSTVDVDGRTVRLDEACAILAAFDGKLDLDSRGAVLWREFITQFDGGDLLDAGALFAQPFDPSDPVGTPRGLAGSARADDLVLGNLARAVLVLESAGFALDTPLGELQHSNKNGGRIPVHSGHGFWEGVTNYTNHASNGTTLEPDVPVASLVEGSRFLRADGYPVNRGTSFIMVMEFTDGGPRARALLTYSQSGDSESPHYSDQTELFSRKEWRPILFRTEDIEADPALRAYRISAAR